MLVDNLASGIELVGGGGILVGGSNADDLYGSSMTGESLGTSPIGWDTSDEGEDVTDTSSQSSRMICRCAMGLMSGAISGGGSGMMELSSVGMT